MGGGEAAESKGTDPAAPGGAVATPEEAQAAAGSGIGRSESTTQKELAGIERELGVISGRLKLLHESHQTLHSAFKEHIHLPVEVTHAAEGAPAETEEAPAAVAAAGETKAETAAPAIPPEQPHAPAAPPRKAKRWL